MTGSVDAAEIVRRFEMSTMTLHSAHREWLIREISAALSVLADEIERRGRLMGEDAAEIMRLLRDIERLKAKGKEP